MQLTQENDVPTLAPHGRLQGAKSWVLRKLPPKPLPGYPAAHGKRGRRANDVAGEDHEKAPPQSEKEAAANRQHSARKQENVTNGKKQWIVDRSPCPPPHYPLLQYLNKINNRKKARKHGNQRKCNRQSRKLPINRTADIEHLGIVRVSYAPRKFCQLDRRF